MEDNNKIFNLEEIKEYFLAKSDSIFDAVSDMKEFLEENCIILGIDAN